MVSGILTQLRNEEIMEEVKYQIQYFKPRSQYTYLRYIKEFFAVIGDMKWCDRDDIRVGRRAVETYIAWFREHHSTNQAYINNVVRSCIGLLYRMQRLPLPVRLPHTDPAIYDTNKTNLLWEAEKVKALIQAARQSNPRIQFIVAVSTIYAPRSGEITLLGPQSIDRDRGIIRIRTEKNNAFRHHLIPPEIQPVLYSYDWRKTLTNRIIRYQFRKLCDDFGIEREEGQLFHSIRRTFQDLMSFLGVPIEKLYRYIGWRFGGTIDHYARYYPFNPQNDREIFAVHPFLAYWR